ncbi:MAG: hypothetical protein AVDCRST_MAG66-4442, partial [uncultured Pseudonocardia sp.]
AGVPPSPTLDLRGRTPHPGPDLLLERRRVDDVVGGCRGRVAGRCVGGGAGPRRRGA